jgi:tRNA (Thr-GGU) A37 N-methylase
MHVDSRTPRFNTSNGSSPCGGYILREVVTFKPVGIVRTQASDDLIRAGKGRESIVEIYPEFENALEGIDGISHLFILGYFHKLRPEQVGSLQVKPRRLLASVASSVATRVANARSFACILTTKLTQLSLGDVITLS